MVIACPNHSFAWFNHAITQDALRMLDYSMYALYKFFRHPQITGERYIMPYDKLTDIRVPTKNEHEEEMDEFTVTVTIKKLDKGRTRKMFLDWLNVGCRQMSDGEYEIEVP